MGTSEIWGRLQEARAHVTEHWPEAPQVAVVLGSGLGGFVDTLEAAVSLPYSDIPHMPTSGVAGHAGKLLGGRVGGRGVVVMAGRVHMYEGHPPDAVVFGVRLMRLLGARVVILTNAAGGVGEGLQPGSLVCIEDHINLTGRNCLEGPNVGELGPRFPDMSHVYDPALIELSREVASEQGFSVQTGVYAGMLGPSYETPAEVRMLRAQGAHLVGMSTVQEAIAARHAGARVLGLSCVTNVAAGLAPDVLDHEDVQRVAAQASASMCQFLAQVIARVSIGSEVSDG